MKTQILNWDMESLRERRFKRAPFAKRKTNDITFKKVDSVKSVSTKVKGAKTDWQITFNQKPYYVTANNPEEACIKARKLAKTAI